MSDRIINSLADIEALALIVTRFRLDFVEVGGVRIGKTTHEPAPAPSSDPIDPADPYGAVTDDEMDERHHARSAPSR